MLFGQDLGRGHEGALVTAFDAEEHRRHGDDRLPGADVALEETVHGQRVAEVAEGRGVPAAQVALAWILQRPGITAPIIGATKPHHLTDALAAEQLELSADEVARLEEPYVPHPVLGHF